MTAPNWNSLCLARIEAKPAAGLWTVAIEYVAPSRLLRFRVAGKDGANKPVRTDWKLSDDVVCGPDGNPVSTTKSSLLCSAAPQGALVGKLGGSSADVPDTSQPSSPYSGKKVFAVGSYCLLTLGPTDSGPLFLTMNDSAEFFKYHSGMLHVQIEDAAV